MKREKKKAARNRRPDDWLSLEQFGKALKVLAETGNWRDMKQCEQWRGIKLVDVADGIIEIARGKDAGEVFGQQTGKPGRQSERLINFTRSWVYWKARAENPADIAAATQAAQKHFSYLPAPAPATVKRNANRDWKSILERLQFEARFNGGADPVPLVEFLRKRTAR
jgi:hypothetical protein